MYQRSIQHYPGIFNHNRLGERGRQQQRQGREVEHHEVFLLLQRAGREQELPHEENRPLYRLRTGPGHDRHAVLQGYHPGSAIGLDDA